MRDLALPAFPAAACLFPKNPFSWPGPWAVGSAKPSGVASSPPFSFNLPRPPLHYHPFLPEKGREQSKALDWELRPSARAGGKEGAFPGGWKGPSEARSFPNNWTQLWECSCEGGREALWPQGQDGSRLWRAHKRDANLSLMRRIRKEGGRGSLLGESGRKTQMSYNPQRTCGKGEGNQSQKKRVKSTKLENQNGKKPGFWRNGSTG